MRKLHDPLRVVIAQKILKALQSYPLEISLEEIYSQLISPPQSNMGDLSLPCFIFAKKLKKAPGLLAKDLEAYFLQGSLPEESSSNSCFEKVQAVGPYLNFSLSLSFVGTELLEKIQTNEFFSWSLTEKNAKTMIEHCQPNTHKELHVGHMRNASLGDALVKMFRYIGYEIISATFPGDVGTHVAKCLWYLKYHNQNPWPTEQKGEWLGKIYSIATLKFESELGTDKEKSNQEQLGLILKEIEAKKGEFYELWKETREWSIELMKKVYEWADVHFDKWYFESDVDSDSLVYIKKLYVEGKLELSQGAVGMNLEADKLGFCLLLKSDGTGLYATKDLELARRKFEEYKIEKSIYVVDIRQELHFKQVFKVLEKIGYKEAQNCHHLSYNYVELPEGPMSSRKGNIIPLTLLVHNMEQMVKDKYLSRYNNEWSLEEVNLVARQVAQGAIKYGMLRIDTNKKIVFDMEEWLKLDGDSGPFIQYSIARINSLCQKFNYQKLESSEKNEGGIKQDLKQKSSVSWELLASAPERKLIQYLIDFHTVLVQATEEYRPSVLCTYLLELAKAFNLFYHECSIGGAADENLKQARLALSFTSGEILKKGLSLLGIPSPRRM